MGAGSGSSLAPARREAKQLALSAFLNERSELSPEMALRIEVAFGPKADVMMAIQTDCAMARARSRLPEIEANVRRVRAPSS